MKGEEYIVSVTPIIVSLSENSRDHFMTLCLVYKVETFLDSLREDSIITKNFLLNLALMIMILILTVLIASYIAFKISNNIFKPLSRLNAKMG